MRAADPGGTNAGRGSVAEVVRLGVPADLRDGACAGLAGPTGGLALELGLGVTDGLGLGVTDGLGEPLGLGLGLGDWLGHFPGLGDAAGAKP